MIDIVQWSQFKGTQSSDLLFVVLYMLIIQVFKRKIGCYNYVIKMHYKLSNLQKYK